jgi:hypothetical protein
MNKQELIDKYEAAECVVDFVSGKTLLKNIRRYLEQLDEPETSHADEAPRYLKNILARLRELPLHNREVWLKVIMSEFKQDFSHAKWREGYEQGKLEGMVEREKVKVPQFIAEFITEQKKLGHTLSYSIDASMSDRVAEWYWDNSELFARAWLDGYEVEEEKRCRVKIKGTSQYLCKDENSIFFSSFFISDFTRNDIEDLDFGWVLDCPGIEIEEVE